MLLSLSNYCEWFNVDVLLLFSTVFHSFGCVLCSILHTGPVKTACLAKATSLFKHIHTHCYIQLLEIVSVKWEKVFRILTNTWIRRRPRSVGVLTNLNLLHNVLLHTGGPLKIAPGMFNYSEFKPRYLNAFVWCVHVNTCMYIRSHICTRIYIYVCMFVCVYVQIIIYTYIYIYI